MWTDRVYCVYCTECVVKEVWVRCETGEVIGSTYWVHTAVSLVHGIVHLNLLLQRHNNHQDLYLYRVYDNNKHFFIYIFIVFAIKYFATDYMKDFQSEVSQLLIILGELLSVLRVRAVCVWCTLSARFTSKVLANFLFLSAPATTSPARATI